jgi:hypothetical protein
MLLTRGAILKRVPAVAVAAMLAMPVAASAQAAAPATPAAASAQAVVRAVIVDGKSVTQTDRVHRSRFADLTEETTIAVNTPLEAGDLIRALDSKVLVELECASKGRTPFRFSSGFRVVVLPPRQDVPCVMQLLAGGVDVRTEEATEINAGGIVLGSRGTQYAVQLRRTDEGTVCDGVVFDDELEVKVPAREAMKLASNSGWTYNLVTGTGRRGAVPERAIEWSAAVATAFDLTLLDPGAAGSPEAQKQLGQQLFELNMAVLRAPANQELRAELGRTQQRLGITAAARYNLKRAGAPKIEQATPRGSDVPAGRALELVRAGNPAAAIEMLQPKVDSSQATARDYYVLAEAYLAARDRASARRMAEQALAAPDAATALNASEIETLRALQRGK